jgi:radical SAM superfamily enzyme YgiQ (UPF0313 family)
MSTAKVLLLNPPSKHGVAVVRDTLYGCWCKGRASYMWPPLGLAQIAAIIEKAGISCSLLDSMALRHSHKTCIEEIEKVAPKYIIVSTATITFSSDVELLKEVKKKLKGVRVIMLGTHVTVMPRQTLKERAVDYVIIGEPDVAVKDLIVCLEKNQDPAKIKGVGFVKGRETIITGTADIIEDLDSLPFPARHLYPKEANYFNPLAKRLPYTTALSSRGCPGMCIYCTSVTLYGKRYRARSPKNVVDEIEECIRLGYREIFFRDETFSMNKKRTIEICREIMKRKLDVTWMINSRVNTVDDESLGWMKKAGCHMIKFGVESGSQQILNTLRKGITLEQTRTAFALCKKHKISSVAHLMFGSPGESAETVRQTIKFVKEIDPDYASFNITTPYPGTELWDMVKDKLDVKDDFSAYDIEKTLENARYNEKWCDLTIDELDSFYNKAYNSFYFRPSYIIKRLIKQKGFKDLVRAATAGVSLVGFTIRNKMKK